LFTEEGEPAGLQLFVGLFTWHAYRVSPQTVPLLAGKVENVLRRSGAPLGSHDRRALVHIIESFPRDELFQLDEDQLLTMALGIRDLEQRPRVGLFVRPDLFLFRVRAARPLSHGTAPALRLDPDGGARCAARNVPRRARRPGSGPRHFFPAYRTEATRRYRRCRH